MTYTPINWAENLEVTAVKLDKMDSQIDANDSDIINHEGRITTNENDISNTKFDIGGGVLDDYGDTTINLNFAADKIIVGSGNGGNVNIYTNTSTANVVFPSSVDAGAGYFYVAVKTP